MKLFPTTGGSGFPPPSNLRVHDHLIFVMFLSASAVTCDTFVLLVAHCRYKHLHVSGSSVYLI